MHWTVAACSARSGKALVNGISQQYLCVGAANIAAIQKLSSVSGIARLA